MYLAIYMFSSLFVEELQVGFYRYPELSGILPIASGFGSYVVINEFSKLVARSATYTGV